MKAHTILVSDIHIGSPVSRGVTLVETLEKWEFEVLIIVGDLFNDLEFTRLTKEDWKLLSYLRWLSNPKRGVKVIWVQGNHDIFAGEVIAHLLGLHFCEEYEWDYEGVPYEAIHGHQFDHFVEKNPTITNIACAIYFTLQLLDKKTHKFSRFVKRISKKWLRLSKEVATKASDYVAKKRRNIFCGHTHRAASKDGEFKYYNTGCWTDVPSTLVAVDRQGVHFYDIDAEGVCRKREEQEKH